MVAVVINLGGGCCGGGGIGGDGGNSGTGGKVIVVMVVRKDKSALCIYLNHFSMAPHRVTKTSAPQVTLAQLGLIL